MRINKTLTKSYILTKVDEIDIFSEYLQVDDRDIEICIRDGLLMCNPLRVDENPTVGFRYNSKGRLKMRDFSGYFWGDCFDLVAHMHNKNVNSKEDFYLILYDIAVRFALIKDGNYKEASIAKTKKRKKELREKIKHVITINTRHWNSYDKIYWSSIFKYENRAKEYLDYFRVYPVENYWIDADSQPNAKYYYKPSDPCYAYYDGVDIDGIADYKLYFPLRDRKNKFPRFITNFYNISGVDYLPSNPDYIIITKSYKDLMSMYSFAIPINPKIGVVTTASESAPITKQEYEFLSSKVTNTIGNTNIKAIFTLFDFDRAGVVLSNKMRKDYKTLPFFLTNGRFSTINYEGKDFTDTIKERGKPFIENIVNSTIIEINKLIK